VTCLAQSPADAAVLAFATRRRALYLSRDGGSSWTLLADAKAGEDERKETQ